MSNPQFPTDTPNVSIQNPKTRLTVRSIIDGFGASVFVVGAVDAASPAFDLAWLLVPAGAAYIALRTVFGFTVDNRNTPKITEGEG